MIPTLICWALYEVNNMFSPGPAKAGVQEHFLGERIYGTTGIRRYSQIFFLWSVSWPIAVRIWLCSEKSKLELLRPSSSNLPGWWTTQRQKLVNFHYDPRFLRQQLLRLQYLYHLPLFKVNWTRISEYKHSPNQPAGVRDYPGTVVSISISTCTHSGQYQSLMPSTICKMLSFKFNSISGDIFLWKTYFELLHFVLVWILYTRIKDSLS